MLDNTFCELDRLAETIVEAKFGPLCERTKHEFTHLACAGEANDWVEKFYLMPPYTKNEQGASLEDML